jgi:two-component system, NtrC family, sensor kinase
MNADANGMTALPTSRILLVDDNEQNRYVLSRILIRAGLNVEQVATGKAALERVRELPDLVILDVKLPDISGYQVCHQIKSDRATAAVPVLQISASFVSNESKVQALEGGADGYLTHPIDATVLVATVKSLLRLKQAEAISRLSAQQWQSTVDALPEHLVLLDTENKVVRCNRAFIELIGKPFSEVIGSDGVAILNQMLGSAEFLTGPLTTRYVAELQRGSHWFRVTADAVQATDQRIGSIVVLTNITDRKLAEEYLRNAEKLAATGRLAQTIAHEINNPLEALTNLLYLASHTDEPEGIHEYLRQATKELDRVAKITKQVLSFHRETKIPVELDVQDMVHSVLALYEIQLKGKQIKVDYEQGRSFMVQGFPGELRQVMANLIGNAIDASPDRGKITIRIHHATHQGVPGIVFSIHDRGPGIPREIHDHILEPFFTTKELRGTGLGLWLAKSIVLKHEGSLSFRSNCDPGHSGTCFRIFLPGGHAVEAQANAREANCQSAAAGKVLMIDQDGGNQENRSPESVNRENRSPEKGGQETVPRNKRGR